jgi:hypothetical protein
LPGVFVLRGVEAITAATVTGPQIPERVAFAGWTLADVQAATGLPLDCLGKVERNTTDPHWSTLKLLAELFGPELLGIKRKRAK